MNEKNRALVNMNKELENCSFSKCVLMIFVVIGHSVHMWTGDWFTKDPVFKSPILGMLSELLSSFHIYAFTLISGYIFYYLKYEVNRYNNRNAFLWNKTKRLLIPYLFISTIWAGPIQQYFFHYDFGTYLKKYYLATSPNQLWFLIMLFEVFALSIYMSEFWEKKEHLPIIINLGLWGIGSGALLVGLSNVFQIWTTFTYVLFFWCGFVLRKSATRKSYYGELFRKTPLYLLFVAFIGLFVCLKILDCKQGDLYRVLRGIIQLPLHISGALAGFKLLQIIADKIRWQNSRTFIFFSKRSMGIYLFHQQLIYISIAILNGKVSALSNACLNFLFAISISTAIVSIMLKYTITRLLIGEKQGE